MRAPVIKLLRTRLAGGSGLTESVAVRVAAAGVGWLLWPILIGIAAGAAIWPAIHTDRLADLFANKLLEPERRRALATVGVSIGATALVYGLTILGRRFGTGRFEVARTVGWLNRRLAWVMALPLVALLRAPVFEKENPKLTLFIAVVAAALAGYSVYAIRRDAFALDSPAMRTAAKWASLTAVLGIWAAYAIHFGRLAVTNHHALNTRIADLGYYDNIFFQSSHGRPLGCTFIKGGFHYSSHFDPILVLMSPLYRLYQHAEFVLVLQAIWIGSAVVPMYLLAAEKLRSRGAGVVMALCLAAYPALHGANMYEFHSLALIIPLVLWLLYFFETERPTGYFVTLALLLLCREDVSLLMCFVGLYVLLSRKRGSMLGWSTIVASILYFAFVKAFIMKSADLLNSGDESTSFAYYYADLIPNKSGVLGLLTTLATNPVFVIKTAFDEPKLLFAAQILVPLLFLPLFARRARLMLVYGFAFCLLATRTAVFSIHFQYSSILFPLAFASTPLALKQIEEGGVPAFFALDAKRLVRALLGAMAVATAITSWKFGGIVDNATFHGGFTTVVRNLTQEQRDNYAWVRQQVAAIPKDASVAATSRMGPHISNRRDAYFYPNPRKPCQYVFIDEGELRTEEAERLKSQVAAGKLVEVSRQKRLALFKSSE